MKIVGSDNLNRDYVSQDLWLENIPNSKEAKLIAEMICAKLNYGLGDSSGLYYSIQDDNYKVYKFEGY